MVGGVKDNGNVGEFFTTVNGALRSGLTKVEYNEGLQIMRHYTTVRVYEVIQTSQAAFGTTYANTNYGEGGLPQVVIPNAQTILKPLYDVILIP